MSNPNRLDRGRLSESQLDAELAEIAAAQRGDAAATLALVARYRPLIASLVGKTAKARGLGHHDREDLQADLTICLLETIKGFDLATRQPLAVVLPKRFAGVVSTIHTAVTIPKSSLSRYYAILKDAEGIVSVAADLAPEHGMTRETFISIHSTLRTGSPEDAAETPWSGLPDNLPTEPQAAAIDTALAVLTDKQREVIELAYGFQTLGGRSDDWIAAELGKSKSVVKRTREQALEKMRAVLPPDREAIAAFPLETVRPPRYQPEEIDWDARQANWRLTNQPQEAIA